jgi:hypothetical protein
MNITHIKLARLNKVNSRVEANKFQRYLIRYFELLSLYSFVRVHFYILERVISKIYNKILTYKKVKIEFSNKLIYSVFISGGIGDAIVIARLIRDIQSFLNYEFEFDVYFHSPQMINKIFANIKGFRETYSDNIYKHVDLFYLFSISCNTFIKINGKNIENKHELINFPKVLKLFSNIESFKKNENLEKFIAAHPLLDGDIC